ncbi:MAG TPA: spore cortex-lytic enzyme, partial [Virgibacillus sp.]|nr:spore cortex-lytic enzyme [Virgibacillus sp.]
MSYKRCSFIIIAFCLLSFGLQSTQSVKPIHAFSPQVIQQGAVGEDVIELQARL